MSSRAAAAWIALVVVGSIATQGYLVGIINHGIHLPLIRHFAGDDTFARDPFIQEMARSYTTALWPALGAASRVLPLQPLLFVLFVLLRAASATFAFLLARALWKDDVAAVVAAALSCLYFVTFGDDFLSEPYLTHGALAQPAALLALLFFAQGRTAASLGVAGALFSFHGMHAAHLAIALSLAALWRDRARAIPPLLVGSALFLALAAPTLVWMQRVGALGGETPDDFVETIRAWAPLHFFPSSWSPWGFANLALPLCLLAPAARLAGKSEDGGRTGRVALVALAFALVGGAAIEVVPSPFLLRLHPIRGSWILALAGAPYVARAAVSLARRLRAPSSPEQAGEGALGLALLVGFCVPSPLRAMVLISLCPLLARAALRDAGRRAPPSWSAAALGLVVLALLVPRLSTQQSLGISHGFDPGPAVRAGAVVGALLIGLVSLARVAFVARAKTGRVAVAAALVVVGGTMLLGNAAFMWVGPTKGRLRDWRDVQAWSARHRAKGEVVLVPLAQIGFRAFSDQTPAVDFMEGDAMLHRPTYARDYLDKLALYGWRPGPIRGFEYVRRLDALDEALTTDDALRIGRALGARVAVRRASMPRWDLPVLYENDGYVVFDLAR